MPLQLTTPKQTGDLDPDAYGGQYAEMRIVRMTHYPLSHVIHLICKYGNTVDEVWEPGVLSEQKFTISGTDYATLVASTSEAADEIYYDQVSELLYNWLVTNGHFDGTYI